MAILLGFGGFVFALLFFAGFLRFRQRAQPEPTCAGCANWDQGAGQNMLRGVPNFASVMQHLTPNQEFGTKVFAERDEVADDGTVTTKRYVEKYLPVYPPFENRWEYFGGCAVDGKVVHRTSTCEHFKKRRVAA